MTRAKALSIIWEPSKYNYNELYDAVMFVLGDLQGTERDQMRAASLL